MKKSKKQLMEELKIRDKDIKLNESLSRALVSEESLAKDWDTPEEDEAWKDL